MNVPPNTFAGTNSILKGPQKTPDTSSPSQSHLDERSEFSAALHEFGAKDQNLVTPEQSVSLMSDIITPLRTELSLIGVFGNGEETQPSANMEQAASKAVAQISLGSRSATDGSYTLPNVPETGKLINHIETEHALPLQQIATGHPKGFSLLDANSNALTPPAVPLKAFSILSRANLHGQLTPSYAGEKEYSKNIATLNPRSDRGSMLSVRYDRDAARQYPKLQNGSQTQNFSDLTTQMSFSKKVETSSFVSNISTLQATNITASPNIGSQITRHLAAELTHMDLQTQIATDRAVQSTVLNSVLRFQLNPVGLGMVQAEIRKDGDQIKINLTVESARTFEIMKADLDMLKATMRSLGIPEGDVTLAQGNIAKGSSEIISNGQNAQTNEKNVQSNAEGGYHGRHERDAKPQQSNLENADRTNQNSHITSNRDNRFYI